MQNVELKELKVRQKLLTIVSRTYEEGCNENFLHPGKFCQYL